MNEVFVSYKREDEARVGRLVRALERAGFSVWWDRGLAAGESWRAQIQAALDAAQCVIVVWTKASVGPAGDFVRDEAGQAKRRCVLLPVLLDRVAPPLGFGELQAIDLSRWTGRQGDPFFVDLCAAARAKLAGRPPPPAKGPMKRLLRRLTWGSLASAGGAAALELGLNLFNAQEQGCALPFLQPGLSDLCGALRLGDRPTQAERLAWEAREAGSCAALRAYIERFPQAPTSRTAAVLLSGRRVLASETWTPTTRSLVLFVSEGEVAPAGEAFARGDALRRAQIAADRLCRGFAVTASYRFVSAQPVVQTWRCRRLSAGMACGLDGKARCRVEERQIQESETCAGD